NVVGSSVQRARSDDVNGASPNTGEQDSGERSHPRAERDSTLGALERGERLLEASHSRLPQPLVHGGRARFEWMPRRQVLVGITTAQDSPEGIGGGRID